VLTRLASAPLEEEYWYERREVPTFGMTGLDAISSSAVFREKKRPEEGQGGRVRGGQEDSRPKAPTARSTRRRSIPCYWTLASANGTSNRSELRRELAGSTVFEGVNLREDSDSG
jgi:hypothetical protein